MTKNGPDTMPSKSIKLVSPNTQASYRDPPTELEANGERLWRQVMFEYGMHDVTGLEMLKQICIAADRAASLKAQIAKDGEVIRHNGMVRQHPLLKTEMECRGFIVRTLKSLGLNFEPIK